ncbi:autotransporter outer membrane beta-barrel domain-containing protein [Flammeovirga pacifica]|uniref:Secretion system C-terminal sorting domain-containing protein n=1 Tax=Flammeovirga pacifica TaxID=915059 RepID=A0A1S1YYX3_FLAPC|nr:hypothetical protein [Flammeovirga pacifica]OHX66209.1 hypothetical protein NH26_07520 [Flammeovirga pacifica]
MLLFLVTSLSNATTITWNGTKSQDWQDPDNWSTNSVPSTLDDVVISASASDTLVIDENVTVSTVTIIGDIKIITGGELNCNYFFMDNGCSFTMTGGQLDVNYNFTGDGSYEAEGTMTLSGGRINVGANFLFSSRSSRQIVNISDGTIAIGGNYQADSYTWTITGGETIFTTTNSTKATIQSATESPGGSKFPTFYNLTISADVATDSIITTSSYAKFFKVKAITTINQGIFAPVADKDIEMDSSLIINGGSFIPTVGSSNRTLFINGLTVNAGTIDLSNIPGTSDVHLEQSTKFNGGNLVLFEYNSNNYFEIYDDADFSGASISGTGTSLLVDGTTNSNIKLTSGSNTFEHFFIYNNVDVELQDNLTISGSLNFEYGHISTSSNAVGVILEDNATVTDNSNYYPENIAHVNCKVTKKGDDAFIYPIGDGIRYRPISISAPSNTTDQFTGTYFYSSPNDAGYDSTSHVGSITKSINANEYWTLDRDNGSSNVTVTLTWDDRTTNTPEADNLKVVRWDGSKWDDHEGVASGDASSGAIVSNTISSFSPFAIHYEGSLDLPVELIDFSAKLVEDDVFIKWATATEINNKEFIVQKSQDKKHWDEVGRITGAGNSSIRNDYHLLDAWNPAFGVFYYRLVQIDFDGTKTYFTPVMVKNNDTNHIVSTYPNPIKNGDYLNINLNSYDHYKVRVFNYHGQLIDEFDAEHSHHYLVQGHHGIIFIEVILPDKRFTERILIKN